MRNEPQVPRAEARCGPVLFKSRSGCKTCKLRRVKCDEVKPTCGPCSRRFVVAARCDYTSTTPRRKLSHHEEKEDAALVQRGEMHPSQRLQKHESQVIQVSIPIYGSGSEDGSVSRLRTSLSPSPSSVAAESSPWRTRELQLMHHYATVVAETMPICHGAEAHYLWHRTVPQFAFSSEVVLNPMLALSALHLHVHRQDDDSAALALVRYLDKSLIAQRQAVQLLDSATTGEQIWVATMLLAHLYWLYVNHRQPGDKYELPFRAWDMFSSIQELVLHKFVTLKRLGYEWCGLDFWPEVPSSSELLPKARAAYLEVEVELENVFQRFYGEHRDFEGEKDDSHGGKREAREKLRDEVLFLYRGFYAGFPPRVLRRFIGLLVPKCGIPVRSLMAEHDPLSMTLFAIAMCLLTGFEGIWWMNGEGAYEVVERNIRGVAELMPKEYAWCMNWPLRVLRGDVVLRRDSKPFLVRETDHVWFFS